MKIRAFRLALITAGFLALHASANEEKKLNIYNWGGYIAEDTIANFEKETGIKVNYDIFDSNEILQTKLLAGKSGYDIVVPSGDFLAREIKAGLLQKLDKSKLSNYQNLDPEIMAFLHKAADPGNQYAINYMWGTNGIGYNVEQVQKAAPDAPLDSFDMIFDPKYAKKLAVCGITILDSPTDIVPMALHYIGLDPGSKSPSDLKKAMTMLMKIRPYIRSFRTLQFVNDLANGQICVAVAYSGGILQARDQANEAENGINIRYTLPKEGTMVWFDNMAIPKDAPHPQNALLFIDYIMRPEVIAAISDYVNYANGNKAATPYVAEAVRNNPGIYPSAAVKKKLFTTSLNSLSYTRKLTRAWSNFKRGK